MRRLVLALGSSAVLGALFAPAQAQEKKPESPPPPATPAVEKPAAGLQSDKVDITGTLDTWYRVLQGSDHVGYVREFLEREAASGPWRYKYSVEAEIELTVPDPDDPGKEVPSVESLRIGSKLDDQFAPVEMQRTDHRNGVDVNSFVITSETGRRIDVVLSPTERVSHPVATEEEVYYSHFLMFLALRQNGSLARPGQRKVNLFVPRQDAQSPISEVQFEVGQMVKRKYFGEKEVAATRVTFIKSPPAADRNAELHEVFVDRYGRVVEETTRGGVKRMLVRGEEEAKGKGTVLRQGGRRDPFRKDLALTGLSQEDKTGSGKAKPIEVTAQNFVSQLAEAEKLIEELKKCKEENREAEGEAIYRRILAFHEALKKNSREQPPEMIRRMDELRRSAESVWGGAKRLLEKMRRLYLKVYDAFEGDRVPEMEAGIAEMRKSLDAPEMKDTAEALQLSRWISELDPLLQKARTRVDLARKKLVVTGTMLYDEEILHPVDVQVHFFGHRVGTSHDVRFVKPNRLAVINDKQYRVGDVVEGEGVRVDRIWSHGIQVSLKEETRDVGIRQ